ncbi:unnamed protein product [Aphanomyces euteiches]
MSNVSSKYMYSGRNLLLDGRHRARAASRIVINLVSLNSVVGITAFIVIMVSLGIVSNDEIDVDGINHTIETDGQTCRLNSLGFAPQTCPSADPAWTAVGQILATQWQPSSASLLVTTCIQRRTKSRQVALVLLADYARFPPCQPFNSSTADIFGTAMLETTVRDEFPNGAYMLTLLADANPSIVDDSLRSSDPKTFPLQQFLIATNGSSWMDSVGVNSMQYSIPLGNRYKVSFWTSPIALDVTNRHNSTVSGWSIGQTAKRTVVWTWKYAHQVDNASELLAIQVVGTFLPWFILSGDVVLTIQGLRGFLHHKPVMTYDLSAGLERRKFVILSWFIATMTTWIYPDVLRGSDGSNWGLWFISAVFVGASYICVVYFILFIVQRIPSPFSHVMTFPSIALMNGNLLVVVPVWLSQVSTLKTNFRDAPIALGLTISGQVQPSGAFRHGGKLESVMRFMAPLTVASIASCIFVLLVVDQVRRKRRCNVFLMNLAWTRTNCCLLSCGMPNWITGLPLDEERMVKIGNKIYCKPSTVVTLGYAVFTPRRPLVSSSQKAAQRTNSVDDLPLTLVSVYQVVPLLCSINTWLPKWLRPKIFGEIRKHEFTPAKDQHMDTNQYSHSRGTCVN